MVILVGAVSAWLCGALAGSHALSVGGEALRTPGGPQAVWIGVSESGIVASEDREDEGDDGGSGMCAWSDAFGLDADGGARANGLSAGARARHWRVGWARGPPA